MKKSILIILLTAIFAASGTVNVIAQEQPVPQKDTVNIDTEAKPQFYYAVEDEELLKDDSGSLGSGTIAIVIGAVIVLSGAAFLFLRKKK